jgi:hypothetical protein
LTGTTASSNREESSERLKVGHEPRLLPGLCPGMFQTI